MRILLSQNSKKKICEYWKLHNNVSSLKELSKKINVPVSTIENWFYNAVRYIPASFIPEGLPLEVIDRQSDNWGRIKGGKRTYKTILDKYGEEEIRKRQRQGGKIMQSRKDIESKENFKIDINSPLFLEFYGALLGDGWLSALSYRYKAGAPNLWWVGISGHAVLDKEYLHFLKKVIKTLFNRNVTIKYKKNSQAMEIILCHKQLILFMNKELSFPIGKKINLKIDEKIAKDWEKMKFIIRGIFDTDGSLYFDKMPNKKPYPVISIHMNAPYLLSQINRQLLARDFRVRFRKNELILKGSKQINKWMKEIGSSNSRNILKYKAFLKYKQIQFNMHL